MNAPVNEFFDRNAETAFDVNKQYTSILYNCDEFGWGVFSPVDQVELFDGDIETGIYISLILSEGTPCGAADGTGMGS